MAIKCKTALVDPPRIIVNTYANANERSVSFIQSFQLEKKQAGILTIAFSNADRVIISRGKIFCSSSLRIALPTESHSFNLSCSSAGNDDDPGRVIPIASAALAIVLAVYI